MRLIALLCTILAIIMIADPLAAEVIYFDSLDSKLKVSGWLFMPKDASAPVPAMVVMHGTSGIDSRTLYFADELPKLGIAALLVDYKTGVFTSPSNRPQSDVFLPVAFAAHKQLSANPKIDKNKIGIMGFALGGQLTLASTLKDNIDKWLGNDKTGFKLHLAYYPGCKYFINKLKSAIVKDSPIKLYYSTTDSYGEGEFCPKLREELNDRNFKSADFVSYEGATTGFDGLYPVSYFDPLAINERCVIQPNEKYTNSSHKDALRWIKGNLN